MPVYSMQKHPIMIYVVYEPKKPLSLSDIMHRSGFGNQIRVHLMKQ